MKTNLSFLLVICFFISITAGAQTLRYTIIPQNPQPGEHVTIAVKTEVKDAALIADGRQAARAPFFYFRADTGKKGFYAAVFTIPTTVNGSQVEFVITKKDGDTEEIQVALTPRDFYAEVLHLDPVNTGIRTDPSPQRVYENQLLWDVVSTTNDQFYHTGPFTMPINSNRRTSSFGSRRIYQYSTGGRDTSIHAGIDFGIVTGTRVNACGNGKVIIARSMIVTGNSVVVEHAPGVYSLYYHLDSISVKEGDFVSMGDQIGLSGSTGLSTGPHLHWEIRVNSENTDPDSFLSRGLIDKDLIISKIYLEE